MVPLSDVMFPPQGTEVGKDEENRLTPECDADNEKNNKKKPFHVGSPFFSTLCVFKG